MKKNNENLIENEARKIQQKTKELEDSRRALLNILEDVEGARIEAIKERDKTLSIINVFVDGLIILDKFNNITLVNPVAEKLFDLEKEKIEGKNIKYLKENPYFSGILDLILKGNVIQKIERMEFSPAKEFTIEITTIPLKEEKKEFGHLIIFHDISREKIIEKLKTEFVSIAAHQLRTPLAAIKWSLSLLREENLTDEDKKDLLEKSAQSNDRMIGLVNDLLNVTRIEEGRYIYEFELKDILKIVEQSTTPAKNKAFQKNIDFQYIIPEGKIPLLNVDEEKISLAIQNIVDNAVNYTNHGGKVLFKIDYDEKKKEVLFTVKDTGVGIPKNQQDKIFTKFFRGENVMRMETEGTGLGLFISKNIIKSHGGKIWFESEENKGTTFYFNLPIKREKEMQSFLEKL